MNEVAIIKIMNYIENVLFEPGYRWDEFIFKERSYSRWAAYEILNRIIDKPLHPPDLVIESFIIELTFYSCLKEDTEASRMFIIARDASQNILELIS